MKKVIFLLTLIISIIKINAQNIGDNAIIEYNGYSLQFTITNIEPAECEVRCHSEATTPTALSLPATVTIDGMTFNVTKIANSAFSNYKNLIGIEIPNTITIIEQQAFEMCDSLKNITFDNNSQLNTIELCAFYYCSKITSIDLPNSVSVLGDGVFQNCSSLTSVGLPNNLTVIPYMAFNGCSSLENINIPESVVYIDSNAFIGCSSLTSLELPESIYHIGHSTFSHCTNLTNINIPQNLKLISANLFGNCYSLVNIEIPNTITTIHYSAFGNCSSLTNVEIPGSVDTINNYTFSYCTSLKSATLPDSIKYIAFQVFEECTSLKALMCYTKDVPHTEENTFYNCPSDMVIYVHEESVESYKNTVPWNSFTIASLMDAPKNLSVTTIDTYSIGLQWDFNGADSYNIYKNEELVSNIDSTSYIVEELEYDTEYCFSVSAVRKGIETRISENICVKTAGEIIEETTSISDIYPNPVKNEINIYSEYNIEEIMIYNIAGAMVYQQEIDNKVQTIYINVADLNRGVYHIRIKTENGNIIKRFVK